MATQNPNTYIAVTSDPALAKYAEQLSTVSPNAQVVVLEVFETVYSTVVQNTTSVNNTTYTNNPGGTNSEIQFNSGGAFAGDSGLTYNAGTDSLTVTGTVSAGSFTGSGAGLSSIPAGNISGAVSFATTANAVSGANVSGTVALAGSVTTNAQANITSVGTLSALAVTGNTSAGNFTLNSTGVLSFSAGSNLTFGDVPVTNRFYVDPSRTDTATYTANGSQAKPFATIAAALAVANASTFSPTYVILLSSITESVVALTKGHVFLIGQSSTIHAPVVLIGSITVNGVATGAGAIDTNHFAIQGIQISTPASNNCITFTGTNPQRLFLNNMWLQCGVGSTGAGLYADNTGTGSVIDGEEIKVSHGGSGDVYCFNIINGTASFSEVETSGATQVGAVRSGATLTFNMSELDASGDTVLETYGNGTLAVTNSSITNAAADSFGIKMNAVANVAGVVSLFQSGFNVPLSATGQAVWLDPNAIPTLTTSVLAWAGVSFYPATNTTISPTVVPVPLATMSGTIVYPIFAGNITANALPQTWTMYDNYTAALSFDTTGKAGVLRLVTTNSAEGVTMSGYANITGNVTGGNVIASAVKTTSTVIGSLPAAATIGAGARAFVTDCDLVAAGNFGAVAAHTSGANATPVFSDGTNWRIG